MVPKEDCSGFRIATYNETLDSGIMKVKTEICGKQLDENGEERALFTLLTTLEQRTTSAYAQSHYPQTRRRSLKQRLQGKG